MVFFSVSCGAVCDFLCCCCCCKIETDAFYVGNAFRELRSVKLYPSVGMKKQPGSQLRTNFGQRPFMYDIDGMMKVRLYT